MSRTFLPLIISATISFCLVACSNGETVKEINPDFIRDISEFKMDTSILHENEKIEIICASDNLFPTDDVDYYVHVVAVSLETGDTVNLLTSSLMTITEDNRFTEFHSAETDIAKVMQNLDKVNEGVNVNDLKSNNFTKVYSNPEFITLKTSHFPSIIGLLGGIWTNPKDVE